jgi:uncharacterized LabA/DUF88 family protein
MKACVFVDGENFRHSIVELFPNFHQEDYLPKTADWTVLFDWIVHSAVGDAERIRTYWYVIKNLDFFPYHFPDIVKEQKLLINLMSKYEPYKQQLNNVSGNALVTRLTEMVSELKKRKATLQTRFNGWMVIQDGICLRHRAIEFRRAGSMKCNLFENSLGREKAVDVKLAADMIMLKDIYDFAVIITGDQDYVPAVEVLKDCGKRVVSVAFLTRGGQVLPGGARRLNQVADWRFNIPYVTLAQHLQVSQLPLPSA